ncbi:MAG: acyl carrier protein [Lachnospiraceae bacterium]|nr:acyl carrier protein [Lachnospiraceae bacterium]
MSKQEKINIIEEVMEIKKGTLTEETVLADYDEWDSLAVISLMAMMDTKFGKNIPIDKIKEIVVVADILELF